MGAEIKGYLVRAKDGAGNMAGSSTRSTLGGAARALDVLAATGCTDVAIFRVLDDGREERLPSYEEALAEIARLREVLGCKAEEETHVVAERLLTEIERCVDALKGAVGPMPVDPLAALEAAERRLLEAGGWTEEGPDKWSLEGVTWDRRDAVGIARYHAAKGGA